MTTFPGGYLQPSPGTLDLVVVTRFPTVLRFSGERLEALVVAALKAFRDGGGKLFQPPYVCSVKSDRKWNERRVKQRELKRLADGWRYQQPANANSEFARGVLAGRLGCAVELERVVGSEERKDG